LGRLGGYALEIPLPITNIGLRSVSQAAAP
jgi:hypothetical protein